ncbi:MAG: PilZ domain-containing protein [Deltaproteobacteria bacterium]|nr:PilZ domain-containing protein [Deltaproteobacteria bacterium]
MARARTKTVTEVVEAELVELKPEVEKESRGEDISIESADDLIEGFTADGRYIPYGGGLMGWFENSGLLDIEKPNNYLYHTVVDPDRVRGLQFKRWGHGFNRRGNRRRIKKDAEVTISWGKGKSRDSREGKTKDISLNGMRLQFYEELPLAKDSVVEVTLHGYSRDEELLILKKTNVVWFESVGRIRPLINIGIGFGALKEKDERVLLDFLGE